MTSLQAFTSERWDRQYRGLTPEDVARGFSRYADHFGHVARIFRPPARPSSPRLLEIGSGLGYFALYMAQRGCEVICAEQSAAALERSRALFASDPSVRARFVRADLRALPLAGSSVDLVYGGGVIEHFDDTEAVLRELARVMAPGGYMLNTVPALSLVTLTEYQQWGTIPDVPVLRQASEFVHLRLLRRRHMRYGYERSFTVTRLRRLHERAGLRVVDSGLFDHGQYGSRRYALLRRLLPYRPFWNLMYIAAVRP